MDFCTFCYHLYGGPTMDCISQLLGKLCLETFENAMVSRSRNDWCNWANVSG